jgi:hypothetical protein
MKPKQCESDFHKLIESIKLLEDYSEIANKEELISLITKIRKEYEHFKRVVSNKGCYGIKYKTIHDDSSWFDKHEIYFLTEKERDDVFDDWSHGLCWFDKHEIYFLTEKERDDVFDDWSHGLYWDETFDDNILFPTPSPNFYDAEKIYRDKKSKIKKIYHENN